MVHYDSTPQSVLDAPKLSRLGVWITHNWVKLGEGKTARWLPVSTGAGSFAGDVERDLLGVTVGVSRKGRKVRR